jgi:amidophosphoribosyltransferase
MLITHPFESDKFNEECGIFGVVGLESSSATAITALGLHALQHRGQTSVGIVSTDNGRFYAHHALGLVADAFASQEVVSRLLGRAAIGHARYATTGEVSLRNAQPLTANFEFGGFAIAPNGNLTNARALRKELVRSGSIFHSTTDTEVILHLMARAQGDHPVDKLIAACRQVQGAYSLICLTTEAMIGVRDPYGVRPLVLGRLQRGYILASETCALDIIGAEFIRDIEPGELVIIDGETVRSIRPFAVRPRRFCIFEHIYFARPDSVVEGQAVYVVRRNIGVELAKEAPAEADVVVPVPDSGVPSAIGYAQESGIPFDLGIIRSHYVGRTFIQPTDRMRQVGVKMKHNANGRLIAGKRIVLVDDSIVRGTTSIKIVEMLRSAAAKEIHMRIASPPTTHPCFYGVDTPEREELLAHKYTVDEMTKLIGVDSLAFISLDGVYRSVGESRRNIVAPQYCDACFSGEYHTPLE